MVANSEAIWTSVQNGTLITEQTVTTTTTPFEGRNYFVSVGNDNDGGVINYAGECFLGQILEWNFYTKKLSLDEMISVYHGEELNNAHLALSWDEFQMP